MRSPSSNAGGSRQWLPAHGFPARSGKHRQPQPDLPLAQDWRFELASGCTLRAGGLVVFLLLAAEQARAQDAVQLCGEKGTDDDARPIPQSLVPAAKRIFGL